VLTEPAVPDPLAVASSPAPPPTYRISSERILDAATAVFAREGFDRANMDVIAAEAAATKPTLYARFGSKEGLFDAAVEREYELRKQRLFQAYAGGEREPFRQRLHRWSSAYFDLVAERPDAFVLITEGERHPAAASVIKRANDEIVDRIAELVVQVSGKRGKRGAHLVVTGAIDIADAAALCESFLYGALRGLDPELIEAVG
jgi:AcrR family transcriptional regulator